MTCVVLLTLIRNGFCSVWACAVASNRTAKMMLNMAFYTTVQLQTDSKKECRSRGYMRIIRLTEVFGRKICPIGPRH
jgi:hypothetical protein